nr:hypothetical protein [Rhizobium laguerreae]
MLSNVAHLTDVINAMAAESLTVTPELAASLRPYREMLHRYGGYPEPLAPASLPFDIPL